MVRALTMTEVTCTTTLDLIPPQCSFVFRLAAPSPPPPPPRPPRFDYPPNRSNVPDPSDIPTAPEPEDSPTSPDAIDIDALERKLQTMLSNCVTPSSFLLRLLKAYPHPTRPYEYASAIKVSSVKYHYTKILVVSQS